MREVRGIVATLRPNIHCPPKRLPAHPFSCTISLIFLVLPSLESPESSPSAYLLFPFFSPLPLALGNVQSGCPQRHSALCLGAPESSCNPTRCANTCEQQVPGDLRGLESAVLNCFHMTRIRDFKRLDPRNVSTRSVFSPSHILAY